MDSVGGPFIGWDSEGYDAYVVSPDGTVAIVHRTMLFGCSHADPIVGIKLSTLDMVTYIMQVNLRNPKAINIGYSFDYDVNQIMQDLSYRAFRQLIRTGKCMYKGYVFEHVPKKIFKITPLPRTHPGLKPWLLYDIFAFFNCSYVAALDKFEVGDAGTRETIGRGKGDRGDFSYADRDYVRQYWGTEISLLPLLGDAIRKTCYSSGMYITNWYGPGAIASYMMKHNGTPALMSRCNKTEFPAEVKLARQHAYAGGRFSASKAGLFYGAVYSVDLNSAYVAAMRFLPRLDRGKWCRLSPGDASSCPVDFGLYRISFDAGEPWSADRMPYPLFRRTAHGVDFPSRVEGWYWGPEARIVMDDPRATFLGAWVFSEEEMAFPWVDKYFDMRLALQHAGNPAERTYKWGLASAYGRCAQQVGWNKLTHSEPNSHELAWAGFITSWCRSKMYEHSMPVARKDGLVSIDTDGITSLVPFHGQVGIEVGEKLGQWKSEEFCGIIQWQNGVYWLLNTTGEWEARSRGLKRGSVPVDLAMQAISDMEDIQRNPGGEAPRDYFQRKQNCTIRVRRRTYVGYKAASVGSRWDHWRQWEERDHELLFGAGDHHSANCRRCNADSHPLHDVVPIETTSERLSRKYRIAWLESDPEYMDPEGTSMRAWEDQSFQGIYPDYEEGRW